MIEIDIGCGYREDLHYPNYNADIFLEPFLKLSKKDFINKLKDSGYVIIASAEDIPIRENVISKGSCKAVLEHLPNPIKAIKSIRYILKEDGLIEFTIPIIINHFKHYLLLLFIAFPFGIIEVKGLMQRMTKHHKDEGLLHLREVKPNNITPYFKRFEVITNYYRHKWFYGYWGKIIKKYITRGREPIRDVQGYYLIRCWK